MNTAVKDTKPRLENMDRILKKNAISLYIREIDRVPLLTREEEIELSKRAADGDVQAKERLILSNLRFVVSIAKKYQGYGIPLSDLISEGNIGLINAVDRFDWRKGFHFISYAIWWVKQSIMKAISEKSRMVRLPMNRNNELMHMWKFMDEYSKKYGRKPNEETIADNFQMEKSEVKKILDFSMGHTSLEEVYSDEDGSADENIGVSFFGDHSSSPDEIVMKNSLEEGVQKILHRLPDRERRVIEYRFGLNGEEPMSLSSIGEKLNLTKERIRQIEKWAVNELRSLEESRALYAYLN
jgi:RNA polymerase primary sigma factor